LYWAVVNSPALFLPEAVAELWEGVWGYGNISPPRGFFLGYFIFL